MSKPAFELDYPARREISALLRGNYDVARVAARVEKLCQGHEGVFGGLAKLVMATGHIDLAEAMHARGANPFTTRKSGPLHGMVRLDVGATEVRGISVPWMLGQQGFMSHWSFLGAGEQKTTRPRLEVLAHVMANPQRWPSDVNFVHDGKSALTGVLGLGNTYDRQGRSRAGESLYEIPGEEVMAMARALVGHGADVNLAGTTWSVLAACLPDRNGENEPDFGRVRWAVAQGADPGHIPHAAWARAICEDVEIAYGKHGMGERARLLDELGVPLESPVDVPMATSPLVQALRREARWAIKRMMSNPGFDARWRDPEHGYNVLTVPGRTRKSELALLGMLPREHLGQVVNDKCYTPALHMAVESLDPSRVEFILGLGANPDGKNSRGKTALEACRVMTDRKREQFEAVARMIQDAGGSMEGKMALARAAKTTASEAIEQMLAGGMDVYSRDKMGRMVAQLVLTGPALTLAGLFDPERGQRHVQALGVFVRHGFDVNTDLDGEGTTLLHHAVQRCSREAVEFLLGCGADPNAVGRQGKMPLHMLDSDSKLRYYEHHGKNIIDLACRLARAGADPQRVDGAGEACLVRADKRIAGLRQATFGAVRDLMDERTAKTSAKTQARRF